MHVSNEKCIVIIINLNWKGNTMTYYMDMHGVHFISDVHRQTYISSGSPVKNTHTHTHTYIYIYSLIP